MSQEMTQKHEVLSALVDGETQDSTIVADIANDRELLDKWRNYHLIRQTMRKELPVQANFDISAAVTEALADEPVILAPKRTWRDLPVVGNVVPLVRSGGQLALAASVAVAVVFGVQQMNQQEQQIFNPAPASYEGMQGGLSPVSLEQTRALPNVNVRDQQRRVSAYMNDHLEQVLLKDSQRYVESGDDPVLDETQTDSNESGEQVPE